MKMIDVSQLTQAFVTFFVIMDPFASLLVFHAMTRNQTPSKQFESAKTAVVAAAATLIVFILVGKLLFSLLSIKLEHFQIAGGIVLFLIALEYVLGISFPREKKKVHMGIVIIGVPLITGPGAMTAAIILVNAFGYFVTIGAALLALFATFLILSNANRFMRLFGDVGSEVLSRIMGLLLASIAVNYVLAGLKAIV